jgi:uncharacterized protein YegL
MKKKPVTHTVLILDQSGSMQDTKAAAVQNYNEQIQQAKLNSKDQDIFCSLITFNGEVFEHVWTEPAEKLNEATESDYVTEGATAMRDAIGYTVKKLLETTDHKDENVSYLVVIVSDGEENSSKHFKRPSDVDIRAGKKDELKSLMEEVQKTGRWTFTYMGCDDAYIKRVAEETAIPIANCAKWSNATPAMAIRGLCQNRAKLEKFYTCRSEGLSASAQVYSNDSCKLADFTADEPIEVPVGGSVINTLSPAWSINNGINNLTSLKLDADVNVVNGVNASSSAQPFTNRSPVSWKA